MTKDQSWTLVEWRGEKSPTHLDPLERADLNHMKTETHPVSETSCFYSTEHRTMEKSKNAVTLCAIHYGQNPIKPS
jgi:hypothetical protein